VIRHVLFAGLLVATAHDPSCGDVDSTPSGPGAPCTRDRDCRDGLTCTRGACVDPDAAAGDGGGDAATDAGAIVDAGGS
jgi:hypothetical protein